MDKENFQRNTKREYWKEHLQQYEASGISKAAYCREHNLNYHQFSFWYRKFHDDEHKSSPFVALPHTGTNTTTGRAYPVAIDIGGITVHLNEGISRDTLKMVITVLQEAVCR